MDNVVEAINYFVGEVSKKEKIKSAHYFNREKGVAGAIVRTDKRDYFVSFLKNYFESFYYYEGGEKKKVYGVALSLHDLKHCIEHGYLPVKVTYDNRIYCCPASKWMEWCVEHKDSSNAIKRAQDRMEQTDSFVYFNIPLSLMMNCEKIWGK